jgi:hypothetical protein
MMDKGYRLASPFAVRFMSNFDAALRSAQDQSAAEVCQLHAKSSLCPSDAHLIDELQAARERWSEAQLMVEQYGAPSPMVLN